MAWNTSLLVACSVFLLIQVCGLSTRAVYWPELSLYKYPDRSCWPGGNAIGLWARVHFQNVTWVKLPLLWISIATWEKTLKGFLHLCDFFHQMLHPDKTQNRKRRITPFYHREQCHVLFQWVESLTRRYAIEKFTNLDKSPWKQLNANDKYCDSQWKWVEKHILNFWSFYVRSNWSFGRLT